MTSSTLKLCTPMGTLVKVNEVSWDSRQIPGIPSMELTVIVGTGDEMGLVADGIRLGRMLRPGEEAAVGLSVGAGLS